MDIDRLNRGFNEGEAGLLRRAAVAAYVMVIASDDRIDPSERARFAGALEQAGLSDGRDITAWVDALAEYLESYRHDANKADAETLALAERAASLPGAGEKILALARIAAVADQTLVPQESLALRRIAEALGLDPESA